MYEQQFTRHAQASGGNISHTINKISHGSSSGMG